VRLAYRLPGDSLDSNAVIGITWTPARYGGRQAWWVCPDCKGRARKLYLPPGGFRFRCRRCQRLTYRSKNISDFGRLSERLKRIRVRAGGRGDLFEPFPRGRKGQHVWTWQRLREEYHLVEIAWGSAFVADMERTRRIIDRMRTITASAGDDTSTTGDRTTMQIG